MQKHPHARSTFSGKIGFVLSAAGASVGLGNIWRFPYLAAKYGGGIFLLIYILLALTFGYTMIVAETSIGRMTGKSPVGAFQVFRQVALAVGGRLAQRRHPDAHRAVLLGHRRLGHQVSGGIPAGQRPRACGRRLFLRVHFQRAVLRSFASSSLRRPRWPIIYAGVRNGIERVSKLMMPDSGRCSPC